MWRVSPEEEELIKQLYETIRRTGVGKNIKLVIAERICPNDVVQVNLICGEARSFVKLSKSDVETARIGEAGSRDIQLRLRRVMQDVEMRAKKTASG
jgi:hypothetical protein